MSTLLDLLHSIEGRPVISKHDHLLLLVTLMKDCGLDYISAKVEVAIRLSTEDIRNAEERDRIHIRPVEASAGDNGMSDEFLASRGVSLVFTRVSASDPPIELSLDGRSVSAEPVSIPTGVSVKEASRYDIIDLE